MILILIFILCKSAVSSESRTKRQIHLGIGFASEYSENLSSGFGHIFLIAIDDEFPLLSKTYSFLAQTQAIPSSLEQIGLAVNGNLYGRFYQIPLYRLSEIYGGMESRNLYIFKVSDSYIDRTHIIIQHLEKSSQDLRNYNFFNNNCASHADKALQTIFGRSFENDILHFPSRIILKLLKERKISEYFKITSANEAIHTAKQKLTKKEFEEIKESYEKKTNPPLRKFNHEQVKLSDNIYKFFSIKQKSVKSLRKILAVQQSIQAQNKIEKKDDEWSEFKFSPKKVSSIHLNRNTARSDYIGIGIIPAYNHAPQNYRLGRHSRSDFLSVESNIQNNRLNLSKFELVNIESFKAFSYPSFSSSWNFSIQTNSLNNENRSRISNLKYGNGISFFLGRIFLSLIPGIELAHTQITNDIKLRPTIQAVSGFSLNRLNVNAGTHYFSLHKQIYRSNFVDSKYTGNNFSLGIKSSYLDFENDEFSETVAYMQYLF